MLQLKKNRTRMFKAENAKKHFDIKSHRLCVQIFNRCSRFLTFFSIINKENKMTGAPSKYQNFSFFFTFNE